MTKDRNLESAQGLSGSFPEDYHEYVFKDGKLVGDFDNMYRHAKEIPWHQDKHCDRWYTEIGMLMLKDKAPYESILEIGCGLGYISAKLQALLKDDSTGLDAFDVSGEAVRKAQSLHQCIQFYTDNISRKTFKPKRRYDLVVVKEVFWYVSEHMGLVIRNINDCVKPGGLLYIGQSFPALDSAFVGKEVIASPEQLKGYFSEYTPLYSAVLSNHTLVKDGPILHFLCQKAR